MLCQFLLYNKVNQLYVDIYPHIPSLLHLPPTIPIPPLQVVTNHRTDLPVLCGCFPLASYFTFGSVYMSLLLSYFDPAYSPPIPMSPPPCNSLPPSLSNPSRWSRSTELISLCYAAASHQLSILHLVVYICPCHSLTLSQLTHPTLCSQVCSLRLRLYSCPATGFISTTF